MNKVKSLKKITIVGAGYVGYTIACVLAKTNLITIIEKNPVKRELIVNRKSPINNSELITYISENDIVLQVGENTQEVYANSDIIILALPTDYDDSTQSFDLKELTSTIREIYLSGSNAIIVIKSTVPIGYTMEQQLLYQDKIILYNPEFLRENNILLDTLSPDRIVIGYEDITPAHKEAALDFACFLSENSEKKNLPLKITHSKEAESIKLFSNSYLAMRVAFFNELDTFAMKYNLNTRDIIEGVCLDHRIQNYYNNPSFGYGGYCLPKDTKQLHTCLQEIPHPLVASIDTSNQQRIESIVHKILSTNAKTVGIYKLTAKHNSDSLRNSSTVAVMDRLLEQGIRIIVYEPLLETSNNNNWSIVNDFTKFCHDSDLIIANRIDQRLLDFEDKIFSRDVFNTN